MMLSNHAFESGHSQASLRSLLAPLNANVGRQQTGGNPYVEQE